MATEPLSHDASDSKTFKAIRDTAKLRQNAGGYWQIVYSYPQADGSWRNKPLSCRTKDYTEAQDQLTEFVGKAQAQLDALALARDPAIEEIFNAYMDAKRLPLQNDPLRYQAKHLCALIGHLRPRDLNDRVIADYMAARRNTKDGKPMNSGSHRRVLVGLRAAIRWAIKQKMIGPDAAPAFDLPANSLPKLSYMRHDEERMFWDAAQRHGGKLGLFVALGLETAARKGALFRLTWDRVDFRLRTIDLQDPALPISRKRNAVVPISDRLLPVLQTAHIAAGRRPQGRLFDSKMERQYATFTRAVGMPWVTPHIMRHTWASLWAIDGQPFFHIAKMMGDSIATVEKTYAKLAPSDLLTMVNRRRG